jgi:hypothetical protein
MCRPSNGATHSGHLLLPVRLHWHNPNVHTGSCITVCMFRFGMGGADSTVGMREGQPLKLELERSLGFGAKNRVVRRELDHTPNFARSAARSSTTASPRTPPAEVRCPHFGDDGEDGGQGCIRCWLTASPPFVISISILGDGVSATAAAAPFPAAFSILPAAGAVAFLAACLDLLLRYLSIPPTCEAMRARGCFYNRRI